MVSSMNGDIPNFPMGHKEEDSYVAGNLQEEVCIVSFPFPVVGLMSLCAFQSEDGMRQLKLRFGGRSFVSARSQNNVRISLILHFDVLQDWCKR